MNITRVYIGFLTFVLISFVTIYSELITLKPIEDGSLANREAVQQRPADGMNDGLADQLVVANYQC